MSITSAADWKGLRAVSRVARLTLDLLALEVRPGVTTGELDSMAAQLFAAHGARSAPAIAYGFPRTVLISVNDEIVHGIPGPRRIARGDVVKLDVTVEKDGYVADAARSVVVAPAARRPRGSSPALRLRFAPVLAVARAGVRVNEIGGRSSARSAGVVSPSWKASRVTAWAVRFTSHPVSPISGIGIRRMC